MLPVVLRLILPVVDASDDKFNVEVLSLLVELNVTVFAPVPELLRENDAALGEISPVISIFPINKKTGNNIIT